MEPSSSKFSQFDNSLPAVFEEDALGSRQMMLSGRVVSVKMDEGANEGWIEIELEQKAKANFLTDLSEEFSENPTLVLGAERALQLSSTHEAHVIHDVAMGKIHNDLKGDIEVLEADPRAKTSPRRAEELGELQALSHELLGEIETLTSDTKNITRALQAKCSNFWKNLPKLLFAPDETRQENFWAEFEELKDLNPISITPYLPFLTFFGVCLESSSLKEIFMQAKTVSPHITYAYFIIYLQSYKHLTILRPDDQEIGRIIKVMREVYPQDVILAALEESKQNGIPTLNIETAKINFALKISLELILKGDYQQAIRILAQNKPLLPGFSILHEFLALAHALNGNKQKAVRLLKRFQKLPKISKDGIVNSEVIMKSFLQFLSISFSTNLNNAPSVTHPKSKSADVIEKIINMISSPRKGSQFILAAKSFLDASSDFLVNNQERSYHVLFIFVGLKWLAEHVPVYLDEDELKNLFESFFICRLADAKTHDNSDVNSGQVDFGDYLKLFFNPLSHETPEIHFGLTEIDEASIAPLNFALFSLQKRFLMAQVHRNLPKSCIVDKNRNLPNDIGVLRIFIAEGINAMKNPSEDSRRAFEVAEEFYMKTITSLDPSLKIERTFLEWAKIGLYTYGSNCNLSEDVSLKLKGLSERYQILCKSFSVERSIEENTISLRDAIVASNRLSKESMEFDEGEFSWFTLYEYAEHLFGWRKNEAFYTWGERLKVAAAHPAFLPDYQTLNHEFTFDSLPDASAIKIPFKKNARAFIRALLNFWVDFHHLTTEKNTFIQQGEDEEGSKESRLDQIVKSLDPEFLKKIVVENAPKLFPEFDSLTSQQQKQFSAMVNDKSAHCVEVRELSTLYNQQLTDSGDDQAIFVAALMLNAVSFSRQEARHSLYVESESTARLVYQILLQVSVERVVRQFLIAQEPDEDADYSHLIKDLEKLKGKFHGPETHISGHGPLQPHYNAGVITQEGIILNTHIYFEKPL